MNRESDNDFIRGYICAVCCFLNSYGCETESKEALNCIGFSQMDLSIIDKADRETLKKFKFIPRTNARMRAEQITANLDAAQVARMKSILE